MTAPETEQNIAELARLRVQSRRWRIASAVFSLMVITAGLIILKTSALNLFNPGPKHDEFVAQLQHGLNDEFLPHVKDRATLSVHRVVPVVRREVLQLELRAPEVVDAVTTQLESLSANLPTRAETVLNDTLGKMLAERGAKFKAEYPTLDEEEITRLTTALLDESQKRVLLVSNDISAPYLEVFHKITDELTVIRGTEITAFSKDASALDLAMVMIDVMRQEIKDTAPNDPSWTLLSTILTQAK